MHPDIMVIHLTKKWPEPILIVDGHVILEDHDIGVKYIIPVKQVKGLGTADADNLTELNDYHIQILTVLSTTTAGASFTSNQILQWIETWRVKNGIVGEFKQANWRRPLSELRRKNILMPVYGTKPPQYGLDHEKAKKCLETKTF